MNLIIPTKQERWTYAIVLIVTFVFGQIGLSVPFATVAMVASDVPMTDPDIINEFLLTETGIMAQLLATALATGLTLAAAVLWPRYWLRRTGRYIHIDTWLGARQPRLIWMMVVPAAILAMLFVTALLTAVFGEANVETQLALFTTPTLALLSGLLVVSLVPFTEEFIFRGALYNAILPDSEITQASPSFRTHIIAFIVTTIAFAGLHLLAGFQTVTAIASIFLLSLTLTGLRTVTQSVWPAVMGHVLWNGIAALALMLTL